MFGLLKVIFQPLCVGMFTHVVVEVSCAREAMVNSQFGVRLAAIMSYDKGRQGGERCREVFKNS